MWPRSSDLLSVRGAAGRPRVTATEQPAVCPSCSSGPSSHSPIRQHLTPRSREPTGQKQAPAWPPRDPLPGQTSVLSPQVLGAAAHEPLALPADQPAGAHLPRQGAREQETEARRHSALCCRRLGGGREEQTAGREPAGTLDGSPSLVRRPSSVFTETGGSRGPDRRESVTQVYRGSARLKSNPSITRDDKFGLKNEALPWRTGGAQGLTPPD